MNISDYPKYLLSRVSVRESELACYFPGYQSEFFSLHSEMVRLNNTEGWLASFEDAYVIQPARFPYRQRKKIKKIGLFGFVSQESCLHKGRKLASRSSRVTSENKCPCSDLWR